MNRTFASITFTPKIKSIQSRQGSRQRYATFETEDEVSTGLTQREIMYISTRNSFYQATVSETGWPYVQHRGGPQGFLKVLDEHTIAYADFRGNQQYLSAGNLANNDRVALIMMDYPSRSRLKILGHVRLVNEADEPALFTSLAAPGYPAPIERACVIQIKAWDWNCSKHITPRYSAQEIEALAAEK